ncbi:signal peptidase I [Candidatus Bathyarchaeota archaeon]|nr:MAG: signal peptidase I [Candidatus Bathyarchaeota archaeon]
MKLKKKQRKLLIDILIIIAILAGTYLAYMGLQLFLTTDTPLVAIASGSMSPALEAGDLVIIQGVSPTNIQVEDIIVFDKPQGSRTIHRVTQIQTLPNGTIQFKTKGDANAREDLQWIPEQNVHGRVIHRIPYIGWLALDPTIPIIIISIVVIIIILWPEKRRKLRR